MDKVSYRCKKRCKSWEAREVAQQLRAVLFLQRTPVKFPAPRSPWEQPAVIPSCGDLKPPQAPAHVHTSTYDTHN